MRLIVAESRDQQRNLSRQYPDDKVVCVGDALYGIRVTEIINETSPQTPHKTDLRAKWWEYAMCRVEPQ